MSKNFFRAAELFQKAADQGLVVAQGNLGYLYSTGQGVEKDYNKALELLQKAADQGDAHAQYNLGCMYSAGKGVPRDHRKALELLRSEKTRQAFNVEKEPKALLESYGLNSSGLGLLVAGKLINIDLVDKTLGSFVVTAWEKYQPVFLEMRGGDPFLGEYFQWLAETIARRMRDNPRQPFSGKTTG